MGNSGRQDAAQLDFIQGIGDPVSLADQVARKITTLIKEQDLKVGQRLPNECELAAQLKVGRGTVREAVKQRVARNVLEIQRGKGTFVKQMPGMIADPLGLEFMKDKAALARDLLQVRLQIEPWCAGLAAVNASGDQVAGLWEQWEALNGTAGEGVGEDEERTARYIEEDMKFHTLIGEISGNLVVPRLIPVICSGVELHTRISKGRRDANLIAMDTHFEVVKCISSRQAEKAEKAMYNHLIQNLESIEKYLKKS